MLKRSNSEVFSFEKFLTIVGLTFQRKGHFEMKKHCFFKSKKGQNRCIGSFEAFLSPKIFALKTYSKITCTYELVQFL